MKSISKGGSCLINIASKKSKDEMVFSPFSYQLDSSYLTEIGENSAQGLSALKKRQSGSM